MAANDESSREISNHVGQESTRPERAAAQLCQLKIKFESCLQSSSSTMPSATAAISTSKRRFENASSPLANSGPCSPSVEAILAATVSRVESVVESELQQQQQYETSATTKLQKNNMATQIVTSPVAAKFRSKDPSLLSLMVNKSQGNKTKAQLTLTPATDEASGQTVSSSLPINGNSLTGSVDACQASVDSTPMSPEPGNSICQTTPDSTSCPPSARVVARQTKLVLPQNSDNPPSNSKNALMFVDGMSLNIPVVYINGLTTSNKMIEMKNDVSKPGSPTPGGSKMKSTVSEERDSSAVQKNEIGTSSNVVKSLKRPTEDELSESTPKKQSLTVNNVRKKDSEGPVASPVMKDYIDSPGSPMTRSMSRRIEESTNLRSESPGSKPVIAVNIASTSLSENEDSTIPGGFELAKKVRFDKVSVYLFEREQGFASVPSEGGSTLGMGAQHLELKEYSIEEHAEVKRLHLSNSMGAILPQGQDIEGLIVQPVPTRRRRELLRQSGVRNIDALEKEELQMIRVSREQCGCSCVGQCLPGSCLCLELGIECQVDHGFYPCGCTVEGCSNPSGRHEFNRRKVEVHVKATCAKANRELGLPETFENVFTSADSPDHFASQEEIYTSSECSENSEYTSPEETMIGDLDLLPDSNAEETQDAIQQKQILNNNDASISDGSNTAFEMIEKPPMS